MNDHPSLLNTERPSARHASLDCYETPDLVAALVSDQQQALDAVARAGPDIARAVEAALPGIPQPTRFEPLRRNLLAWRAALAAARGRLPAGLAS